MTMKDRDNPIVDLPTLRRDLYFVTSLLLADKEVDKVENVIVWTRDFHETEVRRLMLWVTIASRGLLDLLTKENNDISERSCGEYWADFQSDGRDTALTFRQACNSVIHAKEMLLYRVPQTDFEGQRRRIYIDRITIRAEHRGKTTRTQLDILRFVQIADDLINYFQKDDNGN